MDPKHAYHGHTRSMSSIATTVIPLQFEAALASYSSDQCEKIRASPSLEATIPLPPSPSHSGEPSPTSSQVCSQAGLGDGPGSLGADGIAPLAQQSSKAQSHLVSTSESTEPGFDLEKLVRYPEHFQDQPVGFQVEQVRMVKHEDDDSMALGTPIGIETGQGLDQDHILHHKSFQSFADVDGQETPTQGATPAFPMNIGSLLDSFRRNRDEAQRCFALKGKVHSKLRQAGHKRRTITALQHRSRQLIECLHKDRATTFSSLYSEAEDKATQTDSVDSPSRSDRDANSPLLTNASSWTAHISSDAEDTLLSLLTNIRNDVAFLANRIAQLPPTQLAYFSRLHRSSAGSDPDLIQHSKGSIPPQASRPPSRFSIKPDAFETISDLRRDPLQLLVHGIWDCHSETNSDEHYRRRNVWSSVCAKLITKGATGTDNFCVAVLNEFAMENPWKLRPQFEMLLLEWMQTGAFMLDPQAAPWYDGEPEDMRRSRIAANEPRFCDSAVQQLLELITNNEDAFAPRPCLDLIHCTLQQIPDLDRRQKAQRYFVLVWYCQAFLSDAMLCPESQDLLSKHHIGLAVRQKLLRSIFHRLQMTVATALGPPQDNTSSLRAGKLMRKLISFFEPPVSAARTDYSGAAVFSATPSFLLLRRSDILSVCMSLFPAANVYPDPPSSSLFERTFGLSSSGSAATSIGTVTPLAGTASSLAPSTSSTSITSDTFFSNPVVSQGSPVFSVSETNAVPFTAGGLHKVIDDNEYVALARELQGISTSPQLVQTRKGPNATGALFFLDGDRVSLTAPRPDSCSETQDDLRTLSSSDGQTNCHQLSLYDMLESCLSVLASEARGESVARVHDSIDAAVDCLKTLVKTKVAESQACLDFRAAHHWHRTLVVLIDGSASQIYSVLMQLSTCVQSRSQAYESLSSMYQDWLCNLGRRLQALDLRLTALSATRRALRDKMWFASDVRHSKIYEEVALVARALTTMGTRDGPGLKERGISAWARKKWKAFGPERADVRTLADLSAGKDRGGKAKLSDKQAEMTERWLVSGSIENFCQGEERIQRFCLEVKRAVDRLVAETAVASPVLWSSILFARERAEFGGIRSRTLAMDLASNTSVPGAEQNQLFGGATDAHSAGASRIFPFSLSPPHSRQSNGGRSNVVGGKTIASTLGATSPRPSITDSPARFNTWNQTHRRPSFENSLGIYASWPSPPGPLLPKNTSNEKEQLSPAQRRFLDALRQTVTSLLVSDLGLPTWANGAETDHWLREERLALYEARLEISSKDTPDSTKLNWAENTKTKGSPDPSSTTSELDRGTEHESSDMLTDSSDDTVQNVDPIELSVRFPYEEVFVTLFTKLRLSMDPYAKLESLYELVRLIAVAPPLEDVRAQRNGDMWPYPSGSPSLGIPRTGLTRLQEVTANCEERRMLSLAMSSDSTSQHVPTQIQVANIRAPIDSEASNEWLGNPHIMTFIQALLLDRRFYPETLFRDLQLIAAFVPASVLDKTPQGTAFWTMGLVAMQLKSALTAEMVERAGQIVGRHYGRDDREPIRNESRGNSPTTSGEEAQDTSYGIRGGEVYKGKMTKAELATTSLADAARLYTLAALEGDPTAARELGLFYLTKPEIVKRVTLPLSKPCEVFRNVPYPGAANSGENKHASASASRNDAMDIDTEIEQTDGGVSSGGLEPIIFAITLHWMEFAADAGDPEARNFLDGNGDFRRE